MSQFHRTGAADDSVERKKDTNILTQRQLMDPLSLVIRQAIEPYRNVDSRPPLTYIVLIRQVSRDSV